MYAGDAQASYGRDGIPDATIGDESRRLTDERVAALLGPIDRHAGRPPSWEE